MIVVHAKPKNHPGGVQGAFSRPSYHAEGTPFEVKKAPIDNAKKLSAKNIIILKVIFVKYN